MYIYPAYISKHNSSREKPVIILMIPNGEKHEVKSEVLKANSEGRRWHYLAVKSFSGL